MNMKWIRLAAATAALGLAGIAIFIDPPTHSGPQAPPAGSAAPTSALAPLPSSSAGIPVCEFGAAWKTSYLYRAQVDSRISFGGEPLDESQTLSGKVAFEAVERTSAGEWILVGQFSQLSSTTHGKEFETPFAFKVGERCELRAFGRLKSTSKAAAQRQQVAMHEIWFLAPGADGVERTTFENGRGVAKATMRRTGEELERTILSYEMAWRSRATFQVTRSSTRIRLGGGWFEHLESQEQESGGLVQSASLRLSLHRESEPSAFLGSSVSRSPSDYVWESLLAQDFSELNAGAGTVPAAEQRYVELMKHATLESSFEGLVQKVYDRANIEEQWHEMAGFLNGHPEQIGEFARGLREPDFPEAAKGVSFLALSKTVHPEAREALMGLRNDVAVPRFDRLRANLALVTRKDVGIEVARALRRDALSANPETDDVALNRHSLMHLGVLANLHRNDAEVQALAIETISSVIKASGTSVEELEPVFGAVGNLAAPTLLPDIEAFTRHPNEAVRAALPRALRGFSYAQTEALVLAWLARETSPEVKQEIFNVVHHQLVDAQRTASESMVQAAASHLSMQPTVFARQSTIHIIGPTKAQFRAAKELLMSQAAVEFRNKSGLYSQIASYLSPEETTLVLTRMPEFSHQYGAAEQKQALAAVRDAERQEMEGIDLERQAVEALLGRTP